MTDVAALQARIKELEGENLLIATSANEHVEELQYQIDCLTKANNELAAELRDVRQQCLMIAKSAEEHANELVQQIAEQQKALSETDTNAQKTKQELEHYRKQIESLQQQQEQLQTDLKPTTSKKTGLHRGYLKKKSPSFPFTIAAATGGWQTRYFVLLPNGTVEYYVREEDYSNGETIPRGSFSLLDVVASERNELTKKQSSKILKIPISSRVYDLEAATEEEAQIWRDHINGIYML